MNKKKISSPKKRIKDPSQKAIEIIEDLKKKAKDSYEKAIKGRLPKTKPKNQTLIKIKSNPNERKIFSEGEDELKLYEEIAGIINPLLSKNKDFKIGVALSAGGAKGIAHLGVLRVLEKCQIPISVIAGSSMGSVVGALYALNPDSSRLAGIVESLNKEVIKSLTKIRVTKESIFESRNMRKLLEEMYSGQSFEDTKISFYSVAYNLDDFKETTFNSGKISLAIQASSSIPGAFSPVIIDGKHYIDGGISNPLPLSVIKDECDFLIAVKIPYNFENDLKIKPKIIDILARSISTMENELSSASIKHYKPDFIISLDELTNYSTFEFDKAQKIVGIGASSSRQIIKELAQAIKTKIKKLSTNSKISHHQ